MKLHFAHGASLRTRRAGVNPCVDRAGDIVGERAAVGVIAARSYL
jgi:hypothetical protein